jgi:putative DNA primase/helicase
VVKQLTGGEPMRARRLYGDFFEFWPRSKMWLCTNHMPAIRGEDDGIWRRLIVVTFDQRIGEVERDRDLAAKLRDQMPGILSWAVKGCLAWQRDGLRPPKAVLEATAEYRREESLISRFLEEVCLIHPRATVTKQALYQSYVTWCNNQGVFVLSQPKLSKAIKEHGVRDGRAGADRTRCWVGLGIATTGDST